MTPEEIFRMFSRYIRVEDECWLWEGMVLGNKRTPSISYKGSNKSAIRYGLERAGVDYHGDQVMVCGQDQCVHPDHAADAYSMVGRMLRVRDLSHDEGECRIWDGSYDRKIHPRVPIKFDPNGEMSHMAVRKLVWIAEHVPEGWDWPGEAYYEPTCGNYKCVSHKHIERKADEGETYDYA